MPATASASTLKTAPPFLSIIAIGLRYNRRNRGKMNCDWSHSHVTPAARPLMGSGSPPDFNKNNEMLPGNRPLWIGVRRGYVRTWGA